MRTIALEEHFTTEELAANSAATASIAQPGVWAECMRLLLDITEERIPAMDAAGLDVQVLSLNSPGIQAEKDPSAAVSRAQAVNDLLKETIAIRPDRFSGFAALPLQDPKAAAKELERAVKQLGLKGGLVNGHSQGRYLDHPDFRVLWEKVAELDVPLYLHPASSVDTPDVLEGYPVLAGPMWSWGNDTASHVLRMVFGGVFDDFPDAKLMVGHMGEGLPYILWRLDSRWGWHNHYGVELKREKPSDYIRHNLYITTSGVCDETPLRCALEAMGSEHILFGADYPFEDLQAATSFLRKANIDETHRARIAHRNAERLLRL
ncbi:amidohydrolase family protein (plasmid) [Agrobacterium leguminum]|uniref:Amidohydrolase family protein n=1 Tax=Agrobacterium deltaense NCPPB 1641 TaxID=1183425 RepID=A0A1S7UCE9_9HYPH|nr:MULTISPECIES: amidohydrolase family protein [Agrobacterium]WFS69748.1 amidohydrolase family protein [Agrobacterium leguminum]CVI64058.1 Amidohydrolase family protein [Agrobacterium deltaense NCPPB 1641]